MKLRRPSFQSVFQWGLGVATGGLLIGLVASQSIHEANERNLLVELADNHMRSLLAGHLVDVSSADLRIVRPWFEGKIDFAPPVPDLSATGYTLVGGRMDYFSGRPAAALVYQLGKHYISVFLWADPSAANQATQVMRGQRGYDIVGWISNGVMGRAVSEISERDLRDFANAFQTSPQP